MNLSQISFNVFAFLASKLIADKKSKIKKMSKKVNKASLSTSNKDMNVS